MPAQQAQRQRVITGVCWATPCQLGPAPSSRCLHHPPHTGVCSVTVAVGRQSAGRQAGRQTCPAGKQQGTRLFVPQQIIPAPHAVAPHHLRPRSSRVCGHEVQAGQLSSWNRSSARVCPQLSNPSPRGQLCTATGMLAVTCRRACTSTQRSASNRPGWLVKRHVSSPLAPARHTAPQCYAR